MRTTTNQKKVLDTALRVIRAEAEAIQDLIDRVGDDFLRAVDLATACRGKIAVTGLGKSGIICKKIAATLSSTGSPAIFLHAADALHGDCGLLATDDVRSEEHTSEHQSLTNLVCRLLLEIGRASCRERV